MDADLQQSAIMNAIRTGSIFSTLCCAMLAACAEPNTETAPAPAPDVTAAAVPLADSLFGVVSARNDTTCLRVTAQSWQPGDTVLVIVPGDQRSTRAITQQPLERCGYEGPSTGVSLFRLDAPGLSPGDLGVALLVRPVAALTDSTRTDIDRDGTPESYRACTSGEGVHLTVWAGEPLTGRRVWHYYYPLGYDTEPTCVEADYIER